MSSRRIRFDRRTADLVIEDDEGVQRVETNGAEYVGLLDWFSDIRAADLRKTLTRATAEFPHAPGDSEVQTSLAFSLSDAGYFDPDSSPVEPVTIGVTGDGRLLLNVGVFLDLYEDELTPSNIAQVLEPLLRRASAHLVSAEPDPYYVAPPWLWHIEVEPRTRGRTVPELLELGRSVEELLGAFRSGRLTRGTALDLLRAGRADLLIGMSEGPWLDVKVQHYDLSTEAGKISLAQAVARFANAEGGGLVVVGMKAKKLPGGEVIRSIHPVVSGGKMLRRYAQVIEEKLFPLVDGLEIDQVPAPAGGTLVVINVPPQREESKPFLVTGSVVDGKVEGAFISIVRRRGEASVPISAPAIHAYLAAGRSLFRRGVLPQNPSVEDE
jgi:hypothetical protein